jgi:hypothetical protein
VQQIAQPVEEDCQEYAAKKHEQNIRCDDSCGGDGRFE